jgi:hypothetical protein
VGGRRAGQRLPLKQAAEVLGVSKDAVRQRVRRGTIRSEKREDGRVYVYLDGSLDGDQLEQANERDRENRRIVAALTQRIPEIEAPSEPREAPSEPREAPERGTDEQQGRGPTIPEDASPQTPSERPWWRRLFGS